jgi:hypothetical protein
MSKVSKLDVSPRPCSIESMVLEWGVWVTLRNAVESENTEIFDFLSTLNNVNPDKYSRAALKKAIEGGYTEVAKFLLELRADANKRGIMNSVSNALFFSILNTTI